MRCRFAIAIIIAWLLPMTLVYGAPARLWVALSDEGGAYAETAAALQAEMGSRAVVMAGKWSDLLDAGQVPPEVIVTVGVNAFDGTLDWLSGRAGWGHVPVLATLLPRAAYEARLAQAAVMSRPLSAVLLDQPLGRQLALIKRALPNHDRVGVLFGPQTRQLQVAAEKEARVRDLRLVVGQPVNDQGEIYAALRDALTVTDVLLALPDQYIFHGGSLQHILLTTYRARVPVVAFSAAYVKAGALLALYATPSQVARQAAESMRQWLAGRGMPPAQAPREFTLAVNQRVAASLGLRLDDADAIVEDLRRAEARQ